MIDWRVAARSTMRLYRKTEVTIEEANRAASLIKVNKIQNLNNIKII